MRCLLAATVCAAVGFGASPGEADEMGGEPIVIRGSADEGSKGPAVVGPRAKHLAPARPGDWRGNAALYAWFTFIPGTITLGNTTEDIDIDLEDYWDHLNFAFSADGDVQYQDFGFLADVHYSRTWDRGEGPLFNSKSTLETVLLDFALFYEVLNERYYIGAQPTRWRFQPYFGGRYIHMGIDSRLDNNVGPPEPSIFVDGKLDTAAPILGMRVLLDIGDHWVLNIAGDGGGWGVGGLDKTWLAELSTGYRFRFEPFDLNLMLGYKGVGLEGGGSGVELDLIFHGPVARLGFEF